MKTTIDIASNLLERAKSHARSEKRTLREVVEESLRRYLAPAAVSKPFRLSRHPFKGRGLRTGIDEGDWEKVRDLIYRT